MLYHALAALMLFSSNRCFPSLAHPCVCLYFICSHTCSCLENKKV